MQLTDDAFLGGSLDILQPERGYRAGIDAVLLAAAVPATDLPIGVLDAGAGAGVAGLALARRLPEVSVILLEKVPEMAALARLNITRNRLDERMMVAEADVFGSAAEHEAIGLTPDLFDVVMANPPYDEDGKGRPSPDFVKAQANAMPADGLDRWLRFLARIATPGGLLVMIHRADALARLLAALDGRFGAIEVMPLNPRVGSPAHRILIRARKGSKAPLTLHAGTVLHQEGDNGFDPVIDMVLRQGAALPWPSAAN